MRDLTNIQDHPTNDTYYVYSFKIKEQADFFQGLLEKDKFRFERHDDEETGTILFGIRKMDGGKVNQLNYLALGKYRKPFIGNALFGNILIGFVLIVLILAIIGYIKSN